MSFKSKAQQVIYTILNPFIVLMHKLGVTPNMITSFGLLLNIGAAILLIVGAEQPDRTNMIYVGWAGFTIQIAGLFDMMDGRLARIGNLSSTFGAFYDSVIDRYSELVMFLGICYFLISHDYFISSLFAFVALIGSMMVSYTRARAEALGIDCSIGMMQRPARVVIIGMSAMVCGIIYGVFGPYIIKIPGTDFTIFETISVFTVPIIFVSVMSNITAIQRLNHCRIEMEKNDLHKND